MAAPAVAWFEVTGKEGPALQRFYGELFEWQVQDPGDGSGYGLVAASANGIGGGIGAAQDGGPGQVTFYVEVDDPAAYLQRAEQLGGQTIVPPTKVEEAGLEFAFFAPLDSRTTWPSGSAKNANSRPCRRTIEGGGRVTASSLPLSADATGVTPQITDEYMQEMLGTSRTYTAMLLRLTPKAAEAGAEKVIWEHGRRNFMLRTAGTLPIVCPATDDSDWAGVAIFDALPEDVDRIMADDPGIQAGVFTYELHPVCGFPGSALP